jgi:hypothetical protein
MRKKKVTLANIAHNIFLIEQVIRDGYLSSVYPTPFCAKEVARYKWVGLQEGRVGL